MVRVTDPNCVGAAASSREDQTYRSTLIEKALEYRFLADLTAELLGRGWNYEVLRADVDRDGYDLVIEANGILRHIQLKALMRGGRRANITVNTALAAKPSPCVIWTIYDPVTLELGPFRWFGSLPGHPMAPLGEKVARHSRANALGIKAERGGHRVVAASRFRAVTSIDQLADRLFGPADPVEALRRHIAARARPDQRDWLARIYEGDFSAIPHDLGWDHSAELALLVDGYDLLGSSRIEDADTWLQARIAQAGMTGYWSGGPIELWTTLFIEHRRWRFASPYVPEGGHLVLLDQLVRQLREALN